MRENKEITNVDNIIDELCKSIETQDFDLMAISFLKAYSTYSPYERESFREVLSTMFESCFVSGQNHSLKKILKDLKEKREKKSEEKCFPE